MRETEHSHYTRNSGRTQDERARSNAFSHGRRRVMVQNQSGPAQIFRRSNPWVRVFRFEYKKFTISSYDEGASIAINEEMFDKMFSVKLVFDEVLWLIGSVRKALARRGEQPFYSKFKSDDALLLLQQIDNSKGSYLRLTKFLHGDRMKVTVFPAGKQGEGWVKIADEITSVMKGPQRLQTVQKQTEGTSRQSMHMSFADAVRSRKNDEGSRQSTYMSFADAVRSRKKDEGKITPTSVGEENTFNVNGCDWNRVAICCRESLWDKWGDIQNLINEKYGRSFTLIPFQSDKAMFYYKDEEEAKWFAKQSVIFMNSPTAVKIQSGCQAKAAATRKLACTGGWIEIMDLPLKWWNKEVFKAIASVCGGLEEIDSRTINREQVFAARIKVSGKDNGFIPAEIDIYVDEEEYTIKLKAMSRLNMHRRYKYKSPPYVADFKRCSLNLFYILSDLEEGEIRVAGSLAENFSGETNWSSTTGEDEDEQPGRLLENALITVTRGNPEQRDLADVGNLERYRCDGLNETCGGEQGPADVAQEPLLNVYPYDGTQSMRCEPIKEVGLVVKNPSIVNLQSSLLRPVVNKSGLRINKWVTNQTSSVKSQKISKGVLLANDNDVVLLDREVGEMEDQGFFSEDEEIQDLIVIGKEVGDETELVAVECKDSSVMDEYGSLNEEWEEVSSEASFLAEEEEALRLSLDGFDFSECLHFLFSEEGSWDATPLALISIKKTATPYQETNAHNGSFVINSLFIREHIPKSIFVRIFGGCFNWSYSEGGKRIIPYHRKARKRPVSSVNFKFSNPVAVLPCGLSDC